MKRRLYLLTIEAGVNNPIYDYGGTGDNKIHSNGTADTLYGGTGNDQLVGGGGNDRAYGQGGNDILTGSSGNDTLYGDAGTIRSTPPTAFMIIS
ncbi:MAG TPA: hypothetical protein VF595_18205 [Tepidisphaeraceae bacterium]|jgi:Ca2+-binding RTX toxin-like protein